MEGNKNSTSDILRTYKALKENIMQTLNVCAVAKVISHTNDSARCQLINQPKTFVDCYHGGSIETDGGYVVIVFTDSDTRANIKRIKKGIEPVEIPHTNVRHALNYGIIISTINITTEEI